MINNIYSLTYITNTIGISLLAVSLMFLSIWIYHLLIRNAAVADIGWGPGCIVILFIYIIRGEGFNLRNTILLGLVALWGVRIVLFLIRCKEDKRIYERRDD